MRSRRGDGKPGAKVSSRSGMTFRRAQGKNRKLPTFVENTMTKK
jgi:hypothetical protein